MGLRQYIIKRTIYSLILLLFVLLLNFFIFEAMPGDPLMAYYQRVSNTSKELAEKIREQFGLDRPVSEKLFLYMQRMLTWNFGDSLLTRGPIAPEIQYRLGNTLLLMGTSSILAITIGTILGVLAANKRGKPLDSTVVLLALVTYALPTFWMGLMLQSILGLQLKWLPVSGSNYIYPINPLQKPLDRLGQFLLVDVLGGNIQTPDPLTFAVGKSIHMFLPVTVLFLFSYGGYLLLARATMLETITEDYVVTAKAKGLKQRTILFKHVLKNASLPIITNAAITLGFILSGAIITESVFNWEGLGTFLWNAILSQDAPIIQTLFYIIALCVIIANFIADLLYGVIDPRIKYG